MNRLILILILTAGTLLAGPNDREAVLTAARSLIGTQEATGHNDGAIVDRVLASVGLEKTGAPYCAAFVRWSFDAAGFRATGPRSALAAAWVAYPSWTRARGGIPPLPGDVWGIWFPSKGRVAHTGFVERWGDAVVVTIEANTSPDAAAGSEADRNGDGIWRKRRLKSQIYAVRNWLN